MTKNSSKKKIPQPEIITQDELEMYLNKFGLKIGNPVTTRKTQKVSKQLSAFLKEIRKRKNSVCKLCYGKGYSTILERKVILPDFIGDKLVELDPEVEVKYCTCDYGKKLSKSKKVKLTDLKNIKKPSKVRVLTKNKKGSKM